MSNSTQSRPKRKGRAKRKHDLPPKPYKDFPLSAHASGKWQKKIRGKTYYFGSWGRRIDGKLERLPGDGWREALEQYLAAKDELFAGQIPSPSTATTTLRDVCNHFLTSKKRKLEAGEIVERTFEELRGTCELLISEFGKSRLVSSLRPDDFSTLRAKMAERWGPVRLGNTIQKVRSVFKYAWEAELIEKPIRFGPDFKKPSAAVYRKHRASSPSKVLDRAEIARLLDAASRDERALAMILLGLNCGFGPMDCATLPLSAIDFGGWIDFPRPKTGIDRRCPLWPETVAALKAANLERPEPSTARAEGLLLLSKRGQALLLPNGSANPAAVLVRRALKNARIRRKGLGAYALRHTFRTASDQAGDQPASDLIMGHVRDGMAAHYVHAIDDARLRRVVDFVRARLLSDCADNEGGAE